MKKKALNLALIVLLVSSATTIYAAEKAGSNSEHQIYIDAPDMEVPATHKETAPIGKTAGTEFVRLTTFVLDADENILACDGEAKLIKKISPDGKLLAKWQVDFAPWAIDVDLDGKIYIAGIGVIGVYDKNCKLIKQVKASIAGFPDGKTSGIEVTKDNVFLCVGFGWSMRSVSSVVRLNKDLSEPKVIADNMRGCCQRLDIVSKDGDLYIAENARHRVVKCDKDGNVIEKWGQRERTDIKGFGSCCNPMNLALGKDGILYTAESGLGRVKMYTTEGEYLGLVGYIGVDRFVRAGRLAASCSNISIAVTKDQSKVYVLDFKNNIIRVLTKKTAKKGTSKKDQKKD